MIAILFHLVSEVSNPIQQSFVLRPVSVLVFLPVAIIILIIVAHALAVVKLVYGLQPLDRPVGKFPCFRPPDVHVLGADDNHYQVDAFVTYAGRQAWPSGGRDSSLDAIDSSLAEHEMGVVPLVSLPISIGILLNDVSLRAHDLFEFL